MTTFSMENCSACKRKDRPSVKETRSATLNIFKKNYFRFKSFVKVEVSYVFTINPFTIAENCTEK